MQSDLVNVFLEISSKDTHCVYSTYQTSLLKCKNFLLVLNLAMTSFSSMSLSIPRILSSDLSLLAVRSQLKFPFLYNIFMLV